MLVLIWVLIGYWLLMDALATGLCVFMIALVCLPSLKFSCLLLSGLLIYDVFWLLFSAYIFNSNVMVKVATQPTDNPVNDLSWKFHLGTNMEWDVPCLSLPGKLVFSSSTGSRFSGLDIRDIVMPGLMLCFVLLNDNYKKQASGDSCGAPGPANISGPIRKISYFHRILIRYFVGLLTATGLWHLTSTKLPSQLSSTQCHLHYCPSSPWPTKRVTYKGCVLSHSSSSPAAPGTWKYDGACEK